MADLRRALFWTGGIILLIIFFIILAPRFLQAKYSANLVAGENFSGSKELREIPIIHLSTPDPLKALYMTACVAATPSWRESLKNLIETSELNAIVIDIKDYSGTVSFPNDLPRLPASEAAGNGGQAKGCIIPDMKDFIAELHKANIYVIGRISVFQDPSYSALFPELAVKSLSTGGVWKDYKGLSFIDVGAKPYWDYIVQISKASYELGFDELNYDYIRYPSDGNMADADYTWAAASSTKAQILENFFSYLHDNIKGMGVVLSADLFGMTTTATTDMGIGQVLEKTLPYFDYVAPMVYPSHYPATWNGFANPAEYPYDVVKLAMSEGKRREEVLNISLGLATSTPSKLRPWLQDFNLGAIYGPDKVREQIQATYDSGFTSWMIWSAANKYTKKALLPE